MQNIRLIKTQQTVLKEWRLKINRKLNDNTLCDVSCGKNKLKKMSFKSVDFFEPILTGK